MTNSTIAESSTTHQHSLLSNHPAWYAAYTYPRHEKRVAEYLSRKSIDNFLPTYSSVRQWKNGKACVELPLFPSYVFVRIRRADQLQVLTAPSVARILGSSSGPSEIPDREIEALRTELLRVRAEPHPLLKIGQRVRIVRGPFVGREGILVLKKDKIRVVLSLDIISQSFSIELSAQDVQSC